MPKVVPIRVVAAVVQREGRVLVCQRPQGKHHGGLWEFPGGKCEPGESDEEALARELAEELDVELGSSALLAEISAVDGQGRTLSIAFFSAEIRGEAVCLEHQGLGWCSVAELSELALAPADRQFVERGLVLLGGDGD